ncbi:MAG: Lysine-tRNA ligase [Candidatus Uhrbacteria bacterium GW2011_GWE2_40_58]|nr:MAG: Lysine-tRNA ligase [Candidatus Uhrbacteria bacterium GW2011_GWF2_40_263]KKR67802.1 MAG: Lysine-tRNA ligase [Candidatus Uhrbacteria bacterium GW2011_GWE2_40_58]OGL94510.1 MAG: lysine--tRNA ligase [Candidatus Uhrbacteria bacterium RIFOXYA2_FULL_40_9]OGL96760.1 MAG: lysine--tRNA ligase [Candidatus Uhrbacteria bacterium RIFOXYB2_FULL_41_18]HBK34476.1 lysine--tRNA ligase [Candidatus Uhrbacteria bacterium]
MIQEEAQRRSRLQTIREAGINPYPSKAQRNETVMSFLGGFETLNKNGTVVILSGRIRAIRKHGGLTFVNLQDETGNLQVVLMKDSFGEEAYAWFHNVMDVGDFVQVTGSTFVTKKEESSLQAQNVILLTKSLLPLPEKWHGLSDVEVRYRKRYLDLLANPSINNIFRIRALIVKTMREYLDRNGFVEVETPVLQMIPGGASAKPFITHHEALHQDMYLRIAPELFLKRCIVGGFERVYEVARCFRNEGVDHAHNPEFTQIEGYLAYADYQELMTFLERMVVEVIESCGLDPKAVPFQGDVLDFSTPWERITFRDAVLKYAQIDIEDYHSRDEFAAIAIKLGVPVDKSDGQMTIVDNIYKHFVRPNVLQPTFIHDHPVEISPLAKRKESDPRYAEMFQLIFGKGQENMKAYSELNDPIDQEARFAEQDQARKGGDENAQFGDLDFVEALKYGMPPTAGFGIGIDRLTALLTDSHSIKEVILFPALRQQMEE